MPPISKIRGYIVFGLSVCLTVCLFVRGKNFNIGHNFWTVSDRAFIFHMCIPCDKTFPLIPKFLTSWPWPWPLTYFSKTLTLAITFEWKVIGLSYFTCENFPLIPKLLTPWPSPLTYFSKTLTLAITFEW